MPALIGHPINVAQRRTGLSPHVIRVWERRYRAVVPQRTATNRRLYTDQDIHRLQLLHQATQSGHPIGQIAGLSTEDLTALLATAGPARPVLPAHPPDPLPCLEPCLAAIQHLDAVALEEELARSAVELGQTRLLEEVIQPLMHRIGDLWQAGSLRIAGEHLAAAVVRTFVSTLQSPCQVPASAPRLLVTTPPGQRHELGALMVWHTALAAGWQATYLGPELPVEEIAGAVHKCHARAVALSLVYPADDPHLGPELLRLRRGLGETMPILIGGRAAPGYTPLLDQIGAVHLETLSSLRAHLQTLRSHPEAPR